MPAIIGDTPTGANVYLPRNSTAEPVNVERWDTPEVPFDFSALLSEYTPASYSEQPKPLTGMSLPGLDLGLPQVEQWVTSFTRQPEYTPSNAMDLLTRIPSQPGGKKSSGLGLSAYGVARSGDASQRGTSPFGFQPQMWSALGAANAALKAAGLGTFGITDGWRSYDQQVATKKKKGSLAATPGRSVHGIGLAADLRLTTAQYNWLKKNGARFGLVNLPSESWHWQLNPSMWGGFG